MPNWVGVQFKLVFRGAGDVGKRAFDIVVGTVLAVLSVPVIVSFAVGIALSLRAWPFFVQRRVGQSGRGLHVVKLRTLPPTAPKYALKTELDMTSLPPFLRFLRRTHLDELPQLFLVPFGLLSLVGPRPKMPDEVEPVDAAYRDVRLSVAQGCTGMWQISKAKTLLPHDAPQFDFFYVENRSLRLDLWILWQTALITLGLSAPVSLAEVPAWALPSSGRGNLQPTHSLVIHADAA